MANKFPTTCIRSLRDSLVKKELETWRMMKMKEKSDNKIDTYVRSQRSEINE